MIRFITKEGAEVEYRLDGFGSAEIRIACDSEKGWRFTRKGWAEAGDRIFGPCAGEVVAAAPTVELSGDCWLPTDVEWFREPGRGDPHYRPISATGHKEFDGFTESETYPGFYGFMCTMPDTWPDLTFAEITPPKPQPQPKYCGTCPAR